MPELPGHLGAGAGHATPVYVGVVRRQRSVILHVLLLAVASAIAFSLLQTPVYQAQAQVLVDQFAGSRGLNPVDRGSYLTVQDELEVISSAPVKAAVQERLGFPAEITALQLGTTYVVNVRAKSVDPRVAAAVSNTYVEAYVEYRRTRSVEDVLAASQALQARIDEVNRQIGDYDERHPTEPGASSYAALTSAERNALVAQKALFEQTAQKLDIDVSLREGGPQLMVPAAVPTDPLGPSRFENVVRALGVGLLVGVALAFLFDHLDDAVETTADVERVSGGVPVVGVLPIMDPEEEGAQIVSAADPNSAAAEAYRSLRTLIQFMRLDRSLRVLQVTSASASEGKTTVVANLAVALAAAGLRVAVVSCDLRRPRVHELFGVSAEVGFTSVLVREAQLSAALQRVPGEPLIQVLPSGPIPPNPSELLAASRTTDILSALAAQFDIVLVDSPPVLPVTDATVLAPGVDATLVVARAGRTTRQSLGSAVVRLGTVQAALLGVVLNGAGEETGYRGRYEYGSGSRRRGLDRLKAGAGATR